MDKRSAGLGLSCLFAVMSLGCASSSATSTTLQRDAYALASCTDTVSCCLQRNPGVPETCGLTASEAASHLAGVKMAMEATDDAPAVPEDAHNAALPEWKKNCINTYVECRDEKKPGWAGDCYACFRNCEGQHEWPFATCHPRRR
ncbi:hypothetical protein JJE73_22535 [Comamonas sp. JC664]|nr:hypothetical protein [Comamonas sp. JC664]GHG84154.1 hypothetical protein GCM10012319_39480 [Comamonas sp. KCTC 72670]